MLTILKNLIRRAGSFSSTLVCFFLVVATSQLSHAQQHYIGSRYEVVNRLRDAVLNNTSGTPLSLDLGSGITVQVLLNYFRKETAELFTGEVTFPFKGEFSLIHDSLGSINGHVIFHKNKLAFTIYADSTNRLFSAAEDADKVVCIDFAAADASPVSTDVILALDDTPDAYKLQSFPAAAAVAYLDFDGETITGTSWVKGATINAPRINFSQTDMKKIWRMVSEDYMAFNINVTTDRAIYDKAAKGRRVQCIFTTNDTASPGAGGVAYVGSFRSTAAISNPCWVFNRSVKSAGEAASHEIGHTVGLSHDGRTTPKESYYYGQGNWAPIMGAGYNKNLVQWSKGEYTSANNTEDDLAIISAKNNGFGYKTDDHANVIANATLLNIETNGTVSDTKNEGVIETRTDLDVFKFTTSGGLINLQIKPAAQDPDLDISVRILDANNAVVTTSTKTGTALDASISQTLAQGTYYIEVDGVGDGDPLTTGYSDYSSIGYFTISGTILVTATTNVPVVSITSPLNNAAFSELANIVINATATEQGATISRVEFYNGKTKLGEDLVAPYTFTWTNVPAGQYTVTAIAYDNTTGTATSSPVTVIVSKPAPANLPPVVALTAPEDGVIKPAIASFVLTASATDPDGTILKVEFYNGTKLLYTDTQIPYTYTWRNVVAGAYNITAVAYDNSSTSASTRSDTVTVTVINDADRDGIADEVDNCVNIANPDQADSNNNGIGDACDVKVTAVDELTSDFVFKVSPNPYQQSSIAQAPDREMSIVKIYNTSGKLIQEIQGTGNISMPADIASGAYQVVLITGKKIYHQMVIKD